MRVLTIAPRLISTPPTPACHPPNPILVLALNPHRYAHTANTREARALKACRSEVLQLLGASILHYELPPPMHAPAVHASAGHAPTMPPTERAAPPSAEAVSWGLEMCAPLLSELMAR